VPVEQVVTVVEDALDAKTYLVLAPAVGIVTVRTHPEFAWKFVALAPEVPEVGEMMQPGPETV